MRRRSLLTGGVSSLAFGSSTQLLADSQETLNTELAHVLQLVRQIRPGDLRKSLDGNWRQDGGIQAPSVTRYLLKTCDTIKLDIEFRQVEVTRPFDNPDDIVENVSKPYLEYPAYD